MKIFVTGATGALGLSVTPLLRAAGHEVRAVARDESKAKWLRSLGAEPVSVDLFDGAAVTTAVAGCEAVAHLATNVPAGAKAGFQRYWALHNRLRAEATPLLVQAARETGATVFVKESICLLYQDGGDRMLDESAPVATGPIADPTFVGERAALAMADAGGRSVVLRFGLFYGPNARMVEELLQLAKLRLTIIAGKPEAYQPSIHLDDAATAVVAALEAPTGVYNVSEEPLAKREYLRAFADAFGLRSTPRPTPGWLLKLMSGASHLAGSMRVTSEKLHAATGWTPRYRTAREGWPAVAEAYRQSHG